MESASSDHSQFASIRPHHALRRSTIGQMVVILKGKLCTSLSIRNTEALSLLSVYQSRKLMNQLSESLAKRTLVN